MVYLHPYTGRWEEKQYSFNDINTLLRPPQIAFSSPNKLLGLFISLLIILAMSAATNPI